MKTKTAALKIEKTIYTSPDFKLPNGYEVIEESDYDEYGTKKLLIKGPFPEYIISSCVTVVLVSLDHGKTIGWIWYNA